MKHAFRGRGAGPALAGGVLACALWVTPAGAATIAVDSTNDAVAEDGRCSLREAITAANTDQSSGVLAGECPHGNGPDTIKLPAGTYTLTKTGSHEDANASGDLDVESDMTIEGAGAGTTTIDGNASVVGPESDRVFDIFGPSHVTISGVTIRNGVAPSLVGADQDGGGVLIGPSATVMLSGDAITDNKAGEGPINTRGGDGGGIENEGVLTLLASTVSENAAGNNFSGFNFRDGIGGGINNAGTLTLQASVVSANHTTYLGGNGRLPGGPGGGIASSGPSLAIDSSTIAGNFTSQGGESGTAGEVGGDGGGLLISAGALTLTNSTVSANEAGAGGGGGETGGAGGNGGGLALEGGSAVLTNDTLSGNVAGNGGVGIGIPAKPSGAGGNGGAIFLTAGSASLTNVTIAGNAAGAGGEGVQPGGAGADGTGGGVYTTVGVSLLNSILAASVFGGNCAGPVIDQGHNIDFSGGGCPVSFLGGDPRLGPLQDNGGPTQTMALLPGSGALDQVPLSGTGCPAIDQRGVARPQGTACDIGAYELASTPAPAPVIPTPISGPIPTPEAAATTTPTLTVTPRVAPALGPLKFSPTTFHAATSGASIAKRNQTGTSVGYTDSAAATTAFIVLSFQRGVRESGHCVAPPKHGHSVPTCLRLVQVGRFTHLDKAGRNSFHFTGRAGGKTLGPGLYVLEATPRLNGLIGATRTTRFTIAR